MRRIFCAVVLACVAFAGLAQSPPDLLVNSISGSQFRLSWAQTPGFRVLEETDTLGLWQPSPQTPTLSDGRFSVMVDMAGASSRFFRLRDIGTVGTPPDPTSVASPIPQGVATLLAGATEFLYTGPNPIQTGMALGTIEARRVAILRGKAVDRSGAPVPGVRITIPDHPEFGQTLTRVDGMFDLAVNGGGPLTIDYTKAGYLPAQRRVNAPWQDYVSVSDVALIPLDTSVTTIAANAVTAQVHRSTVSTDSEGSRCATLLFPAGTTVTMVMADGTTQPLTNLDVRASEYTVGANGPMAMPGELPPTSGYTYAVEFSVDQAVAANADTVTFNQPIPTYVENFLGFPVGENVPLGYYDRKAGVWVPSENGRIIKITAISGGIATVDTVGSRGLPAMVIDSAELETLGSLYSVGQELWRMPVTHFSAWDANWGISPPSNAASPPEDPDADKPLDDACTVSGNSVIEVQNQILGETIGVVGTPFGLQYQSDRVPGRKSAYDVDIPLSGATLPGPVVQIELEVHIAGRFIRQSFPPAPNRKTTFTWDGKDVYGRTLQGSQFITVRTGYTYGAVYQQTPAFGYNGNGQLITGSRARQQVTLWRSWQGAVGTWDARASGLGGWTLSAHHTFDPIGNILYRGDGGRQSAHLTGPTIHNFAGTGIACSWIISGDFGPATSARLCPTGLATGPDGSVYIAESANRVRRVHPGGIITTVAGTGETCYSGPCGDGGPATEALFYVAQAIAIGPDNSLYVSEQSRPVVRRVGPDGIITTFAGTGVLGFSGDGGPATQARIHQGIRLAAGPDGSVFIADELNNRVRRVAADGIITTVAGTGVYGFSGEGIPATLAKVAGVHGIAVGRDGSLYLSEIGLHRVRRVTPDGIIRTIAGTGTAGFSGDGGPATQARLNMPTGIAVDLHDNVYFMEQGNRRIRWFRPGGTIATLAGNGTTGPIIEGAAAQAVPLDALSQPWLAVGPDGSVYVTQDSSRRGVRRITPAGAAFGPGGLALPNPDGSEVYLFGSDGRHSRTVDALTGALREEFGYDSAGRLASVTDVDGNITSIERDAAGLPIAIVGPFGQRTTMAVNPDGFLSAVTSPAGETLQMAYTTDGLLTSLTNPRGHTSSYAFDTKGRLMSATDPTGATRTLARTGTNRDYSVALTSPLGRTTTYRVERLGTGDMRLTTNNPAACQVQTLIGRDGTETATFADGTTINLVSGPDPRWGMQAPLVKSTTLRTPAGLVHTTTRQRTVTLAAPADLLSLKTFTETVTVNGRVFKESYDATTRTLTATSPTGRQSTAIIDARGRMTQTQFGGLAATGFTYDPRGRLATITQGSGADSRTTTFAYGESGFLQSVTDPANRTKSSSRDADGRVTELTFPDGAKPQFGYDANGNITTLRPPGRPDHLFAYTQNNQVSAYTAPMVGAANNQTLATYDNDRQPAVIDRPDGQSVLLDYDAEGRLILVKTMAGDIHYGHDTCGRIATLNRDQGGNLGFTYDGKLPIGTTSSGAVAGSVTRVYNNDFRLSSLTVNGGGPVAFSYDQDGLLTQAGDLTLTRDAQNGLITATALGSVTDTTTYDTVASPATYTTSQGGNALYSAAYTRDALGRITTKSETITGATHTFTYTYDPAGRLTEVRQDNVPIASYTYDSNGNRLSSSNGGGTVTATYDAQDRLQRFGTTAYVHNAAGGRRSKTAAGQTTTYQYDTPGNLIEVTLPDTTLIEYVLDAGGRRVGKKRNGALVQGFLYQDGLRPIAELDGSNNVASRFVYAHGINVPACMIKSGVTYRIISDYLGSPRLVINAATGTVAQRMDYDAFGNVILDSNPGFQPFGFAGGLYDADTKLVRFGMRTYDPETGRWITKDPMGFGSGSNLYDYAANDPLNLIDPLGNDPVDPYAATGVGPPPAAPAYETRFEQQERLYREQVEAWMRQEKRTFFTSGERNSYRGSLVRIDRPGLIGSAVVGEVGGNYMVSTGPCRINQPSRTSQPLPPFQPVQTALGVRGGFYAAAIWGLEFAAALEPWFLLVIVIESMLPHTLESPGEDMMEYLNSGRLPPGITE